MMFKNIGFSRSVFIFCLLVLNVALLASAYFYMLPEKKQKERELAGVQSSVQSKYNEIVQLREDFALLKDRLKEFASLELSGFFEEQNRLRAEEKIDEFTQKSGVLKVLIDPKAGEIVEDEMVKSAGHVLIKSPYSLTIKAQDDLDAIYFLKMLQTRFLGMVQFDKIDIKRVKNLDAPLLRKIGSGFPEVLVETKVEMNWITMPSLEDVQ